MWQRWGDFPLAGGKRAQTAEELLAATPTREGGGGPDERLRDGMTRQVHCFANCKFISPVGL